MSLTSAVLEKMTPPHSGPVMGWIQRPIEYAKVVTSIAGKCDGYALAGLIEFGKQIYQVEKMPHCCGLDESLLLLPGNTLVTLSM